MKVLMGVQLGAEGVLMGEGTAQAPGPSRGAAEVMRVVVQARADRLQVSHLRPERLAPPSTPLQCFVLDVDDHTVPIAGERCPLLSVPPLVLTVHSQEAEHHQIEEGPNDRQAHQDVHKAKGHIQGLLLEGPVLLESHKVPKAYSC